MKTKMLSQRKRTAVIEKSDIVLREVASGVFSITKDRNGNASARFGNFVNSEDVVIILNAYLRVGIINKDGTDYTNYELGVF